MADPALSPSADDQDPNPQIQQNLEGNDNQAIVEMTGGTALLYHHQYLPLVPCYGLQAL